MQSTQFYQDVFLSYLKSFTIDREPKTLYDPINYILQLGGKRLRPILTLMTADLYNCDFNKAMNAALSIEVFHNFSLIHDDIMDGAPLRRGKKTVHKKWNVNTGILSGDAMLIMAYQLFEKHDPIVFQSLASLFSKTALEVCEGQQMDMDFESIDEVCIDSYLKMIEYKTAVLVGAAMKMGAIIAQAPLTEQDKIYQFGVNLGIAFQIQDDYLDAFGNPETFGKQVGGDIIENKKTILYLKALELLQPENKNELLHLYSINPTDQSDKINRVKHLFVSSGANLETQKQITFYTNKAFLILESLQINDEKKEMLKQFGTQLMNRQV